jgi:hypothetical protein
MFSGIRKRLTYANVAMTLALVFAMSGGAYAAKRYLITSTKQISPKVLKQLQGKAGPAGKDGFAGPAGPAGPAGGAGKEGAAGKEGKVGTNGESVVVKAEPKGTHCKEGGENFTVASKTEYACNGEAGSPWTVGTLPKGASEKGEWNIIATGEAVGTAISFTVPLEKSLDKAHAHFIGEGEGEGEAKPATAITNHECEGTYQAPKAASGQLCVFAKSTSPFNTSFVPIASLGASGGADTTGTQLAFFPSKPAELFLANGSWAVTG